ncbi:MAG: Ppx/GppA family phosphatase [Synergistaceae bacterium]|nr:Ppx/GppA family phosphatase [Synergistaceae bacterium]
MIKAVIDIGSNSIKMRIADVMGKHVRVIRDETEVVRLGRGMSETGRLAAENMKVSCATVSRMVRRAKAAGASIYVVGTMALRTAENASEFVKMVKDACGLDVQIFSGEDEAKYSWLGAADGFDLEGDAVMFDSGGGSTEFVLGCGQEIKKIVSVPIGAVNLSEKFFLPQTSTVSKSACDSAVAHVTEMFRQNHIEEFAASSVIGVGGGAVAMASVKNACENFTPPLLHGSILTRKDVTRQIRLYASLTLKERENIIGLPPSRADVVLGSACIIFAALGILNAPSCIISINGLRHGLLIHDSIM